MTAVVPATLPRLAALVRLLLQLRMLLCAMALLLIPAERATVDTIILITALALLSGLAARQWERFVPYLRSHPLLAALDVFGTGAILVLDGPSGPAFITTVISAAIAGILFGGRGVALVVALQVFCYSVALLGYIALYGAEAPIQVVSFQVLLVHPALYPVAGYLGLKVRSIFAELASEQAARRDAELAAAAAEERERLAREMHDSVAKTLRGAAMAAQALPMWLAKDPERAEAVAAQVATAADAASVQARELISDLREHDTDDTGIPFEQAVGGIVADWGRQTGVEVDVSVRPGDAPEPAPEARREALSVITEALTNVERHAQASRVDIGIEGNTDGAPSAAGDPAAGVCTVVLFDDGRGFPEPPERLLQAERTGNGHYGLLGMVERAERVGGSLAFTCPPDGGTRLVLQVPSASVERTPPPTSHIPTRTGTSDTGGASEHAHRT